MNLFQVYPKFETGLDLSDLRNSLSWEKPRISIFGKKVPVPRQTCFCANTPGVNYRYSGTDNIAQAWPNCLSLLKSKISNLFRSDFNGCLFNLYEDGLDYMGWHSDDESSMSKESPIVIFSVGESRKIGFRPKKDRNNRHAEFLELSHGDLLVMHPGCQQVYAHSIPKTAKRIGARISCTFRCFKF